MSLSKLKILILADAASFHTERFVAELQKQNCDTLLASLEESNLDYTRLKKHGFIKQLYYTRAVPEIRKLIQSYQPDIISAHFASGYGHIAAKANIDFSVPLSLNLWGSDILIVPQKSFMHKRKTKFALQKADYIFADSQYLLDEAYKITQFEKSKVIPWGIEQKYLEYKKNDYTLSKPLKIIIPRAHESVYNNLFIIESLKELILQKIIKLTFPAFGSLYELFKIKAFQLVGGKIDFYPRLDREGFLKLAAQHDIYLSASKSDSSPVSLIEAMALGLIPVTGDILGVREWLSNDNGFLFDLSDSNSLLQAINQILNSDNNFKSIRSDNYQKVKREAVFEKNIFDQLAIFKSLIEGKQ